MFHIVLYQPEIPGNTGNAIRLAANTGARLHLVHPLGFSMDSTRLKRAGLDYHELAHVHEHRDLESCLEALGTARIWVFSSHAERRYTEAGFAEGDALLFGPETRGLPAESRDAFPPEHRLRIPMVPGNRSVNLSNSIAIALFEAWRQQGFAGGE
ncbi:rRNA methylase [Thiohalorhabdus denitrificans]|uniref:tRNA (cytidine(34)-2'-O)-methyltransferase n=1 Tax=Thiohalorhabdus denitrificans TaxID=381306 RepID=A0A0P9CEM7_9GAMM|nr:tRNA (cytidine(34)-2'-O)-methyltransferase [Thiohalorhabdus denitrificans]KPV41390.1 rRNA methylase [Thiohalorhabdus denitrificans]SCY25636.1 tRNA (cytidine/uridine-2'-O-)-methyltransferase [Thiohalorhabdus denitrificans]